VRAVIFANGDLTDPQAALAGLRPDDLVLAADGGLRHCRGLGIAPHALVGDLDSLPEVDLGALQASGVELVRHPARKDQTDLELALHLAVARGARQILVYGAFGARWDHSVANLLLGAGPALQGVQVIFHDGRQRAGAVRGECTIEGRAGDVVSLVPIGGDARGVTTTGLEYRLREGVLPFGSGLGVSNVMTGPQASVRVREGALLYFYHARVQGGSP
jgi:thiamine pyrophosphokinase